MFNKKKQQFIQIKQNINFSSFFTKLITQIKTGGVFSKFSYYNLFYSNLYVNFIYTAKFKYKFLLLNKRAIYLNFIKYFSFFILNFLEKIFYKPIFILFKLFKNKKINLILKNQYFKLLKYQFKIGQGFFLLEMLYVL